MKLFLKYLMVEMTPGLMFAIFVTLFYFYNQVSTTFSLSVLSVETNPQS